MLVPEVDTGERVEAGQWCLSAQYFDLRLINLSRASIDRFRALDAPIQIVGIGVLVGVIESL